MAKKFRANKKRQIIFKRPDGTKSAVWQRPDGRWSGYWHPLNADGTLDKSRRSELTRTDPDKLIAQILEAETPKKMTLRELIADWERAREKRVAPGTIDTYRKPVKDVLDKFGDRPISDITATEVSGFLAELADMGFAKSTIQLRRCVLSSAYKHAILHGLADRSPTDYAVNPRTEERKEREPLTDEQIAAVENGLDKPFGLYAYLLLYTGLRRGEALALRYEDIDRKKGVIHVTKTCEFQGSTPYIKETKTASGLRDVRLPKLLADAIPLGIGEIFRPDGPPPKNGKPHLLTLGQFQWRWRKYCKAIGHSFTPHQLRHTYATSLYEAGVGVKEAQKLLGHANINITLKVYTHISERLNERTAAKLDEYFQKRADGNIDGGIAASP